MEPEIDIYRYIIDYASLTHYAIANIAYKAFQKEYRVHLLGKTNKTVQWFKIEHDKSLSPIKSYTVRERLSTDIANLVVEARRRIKYENPEVLATSNSSIEYLNISLCNLIKKKTELREINKIDEARQVETEIRGTEECIELITKRHDMMCKDMKDAKLKKLLMIEDALYDSKFRDGIMKELVELFNE
jgi:hypothetical protein